MDKISDCAKLFKLLLRKEYVFTLEKNIKFSIYFSSDNFYHLLGLEKLVDVKQFNGKKPGQIYKKILNGEISDDLMHKSHFYDLIDSRVRYFHKIPDLLNFEKTNKIIVDFDVSLLEFNSKLKNTKYILYNHTDNIYYHLTIGSKTNLYPETFIVENGSTYVSEQTLLDILYIDIIDKNSK